MGRLIWNHLKNSLFLYRIPYYIFTYTCVTFAHCMNSSLIKILIWQNNVCCRNLPENRSKKKRKQLNYLNNLIYLLRWNKQNHTLNQPITQINKAVGAYFFPQCTSAQWLINWIFAIAFFLAIQLGSK